MAVDNKCPMVLLITLKFTAAGMLLMFCCSCELVLWNVLYWYPYMVLLIWFCTNGPHQYSVQNAKYRYPTLQFLVQLLQRYRRAAKPNKCNAETYGRLTEMGKYRDIKGI